MAPTWQPHAVRSRGSSLPRPQARGLLPSPAPARLAPGSWGTGMLCSPQLPVSPVHRTPQPPTCWLPPVTDAALGPAETLGRPPSPPGVLTPPPLTPGPLAGTTPTPPNRSPVFMLPVDSREIFPERSRDRVTSLHKHHRPGPPARMHVHPLLPDPEPMSPSARFPVAPATRGTARVCPLGPGARRQREVVGVLT